MLLLNSPPLSALLFWLLSFNHTCFLSLNLSGHIFYMYSSSSTLWIQDSEFLYLPAELLVTKEATLHFNILSCTPECLPGAEDGTCLLFKKGRTGSLLMIGSSCHTPPIKRRPSCRVQKDKESYLLHQREVKLLPLSLRGWFHLALTRISRDSSQVVSTKARWGYLRRVL